MSSSKGTMDKVDYGASSYASRLTPRVEKGGGLFCNAVLRPRTCLLRIGQHPQKAKEVASGSQLQGSMSERPEMDLAPGVS